MLQNLLFITLIGALASWVFGKETDFMPSCQRDYSLNTKLKLSNPNLVIKEARKKGSLDTIPVFSDTIRYSGAPWLRINFANTHLGKKSRIVLTSLKDGSTQPLDSTTLWQWRNSSAYFNGDAVALKLYFSEADISTDIEVPSIQVSSLTVGLRQAVSGGALDNCPNGINRYSSNDPAIGRFMPDTGSKAGTAWICPNGALITVMHALGNTTVEFNVPQSNSNGTMNHPAAEDQYSRTDTTEFFTGDFGIFKVYRNPVTHLLPGDKYQDFYRLSRDYTYATLPTGNLTITGYGYNYGTACHTQQTSTGPAYFNPVFGELNIPGSEILCFARVEDGNSGSPIQVSGAPVKIAIGPLSNGGGGCPDLINHTNPDEGGTFADTINGSTLDNWFSNFPATVSGQMVSYLDLNHTTTQPRSGSIMRPFTSFASALSQAQNGGLIIAAPGTYTGAGTISGNVTITAPVGPVTLTP
jgi:hypothetical protein